MRQVARGPPFRALVGPGEPQNSQGCLFCIVTYDPNQCVVQYSQSSSCEMPRRIVREIEYSEYSAAVHSKGRSNLRPPHVSSAFPISPHHPRPIAPHRTAFTMSTDHSARSPRLRACVRCQQRKVRCDHKSPCGNCVAADTQCLPATLTPRRRRFQERVLLDRLRHYEGLLRLHNIDFEPLHPQAKQEPLVTDVSRGRERSETARAQTPVQSQAVFDT